VEKDLAGKERHRVGIEKMDRTEAVAGVQAVKQETKGSRWVSLDILRGGTVALMILVNTAGDGKASFLQLRHSVWNGCTVTDLVFPFFLFWMGVAMAISVRSRLKRQHPKGEIVAEVVKRSLIIVGLGLFLNGFPYFPLATLRYCGVMQRIGLCYLMGALLLLVMKKRGLALTVAVLVLGYWALLTVVPVPGYEGKRGVDVGVLDPQANVVAAVDRMVIPVEHRYHKSFYDPEGLLSTFPSLGTVLLGALAGLWMIENKGKSLGWLAGAGAVLMAMGWIWSLALPINKRMWTSSYVLWTGGLALLLLAAMRWAFDEKGFGTKWLRPTLAFGSNALFAYLLSELLATVMDLVPLGGWGSVHVASYGWLGWMGGGAMQSLVWSVGFVGLCYLPVEWLYRRKIFIKL